MTATPTSGAGGDDDESRADDTAEAPAPPLEPEGIANPTPTAAPRPTGTPVAPSVEREPESEDLAPPSVPPATPIAAPPSIDGGAVDAAVPTQPEPDPPEVVDEPETAEEDWGLDAMDDPIENPVECPMDEPAEGDACVFDTVCKYGSEPDCRSRWVCGADEIWYREFAKRGCPEVCPETEPSEGDPCIDNRVQCTFGETATCRSHWLCDEQQWWLLSPADDCETQTYCPQTPPASGLDCDLEMVGQGCTYETGERCGCNCFWDEEAIVAGSAKMQWGCGTINASFPASYLTYCPREVPVAGTPCEPGSTCGYQTEAECVAQGSGTTLAQCIDNVWDVQEPPPNAAR